MTEMAYSVSSQPKRPEKGDDGHNDDDRTHAHGHREGKEIDAAIGKENGASNENSENSAGSADRWHMRIPDGTGRAPFSQ